jgi:hypothetical protein
MRGVGAPRWAMPLARLSASELDGTAFARTMVELSINAAVSLALSITLKLLRRDLDGR